MTVERSYPETAIDPLMTPKEFVDSIISSCDPSNWDADRNTGDYFRGLKDAYEAIHEIANEYQTAMYAWTRPGAPAQRAAEPLDHIGDANDMVAQCLVSDWLAMFDPPPQIDFQQSDLLQQAISHALRKAASSVTSTDCGGGK